MMLSLKMLKYAWGCIKAFFFFLFFKEKEKEKSKAYSDDIIT